MMAVPPQIPKAIDDAIPAPPYPRPRVIPQRAQAPGVTKATLQLRAAALPSPSGDPLFDRWSPNLKTMAPGTLITVRDVTATAAPLVTAPITRARLMKFASRDALGLPSFGTATILEPRAKAPVRGPRPILVNNLAINSLGTTCTPGYTLAHGFDKDSSLTNFFPPTTQLALARGYTVIVPDHEGPRMAYAEPTTAGHVILDALRAAARLDRPRFGASKIAMVGYSGGAIATNGATKLMSGYAPELVDRVVGAAMGGVPADFRMLVGSMNANLATGLFHGATFGISRERPEILTMANHLAQWMATSPLKDVCTLPMAVLGGSFLPMQLMSNDPDPFHSPVAEKIYRVTKMADAKSPVPLYIYQGASEFWIPVAGARNLFHEQCRLGVNASFHAVPGEHVIGELAGFPGALTWLDARLRGIPARDGCVRT
ncbi:lipase [Gordonia phthalatica]|uniref:Lipase n=2 Tax=Gordonia phthalatica TaxID=1136941 RepID=A0A0N9NLQ4_9ACTN|nr:lipase [Gordonia phthalatica]